MCNPVTMRPIKFVHSVDTSAEMCADSTAAVHKGAPEQCWPEVIPDAITRWLIGLQLDLRSQVHWLELCLEHWVMAAH